ncbi:hypothetical protein J1614_004667 [Plenodomus biglobosus]|nr:hypothetical protein J1614_004667 [Plenodomus biglobosus]
MTASNNDTYPVAGIFIDVETVCPVPVQDETHDDKMSIPHHTLVQCDTWENQTHVFSRSHNSPREVDPALHAHDIL